MDSIPAAERPNPTSWITASPSWGRADQKMPESSQAECGWSRGLVKEQILRGNGVRLWESDPSEDRSFIMNMTHSILKAIFSLKSRWQKNISRSLAPQLGFFHWFSLAAAWIFHGLRPLKGLSSAVPELQKTLRSFRVVYTCKLKRATTQTFKPVLASFPGASRQLSGQQTQRWPRCCCQDDTFFSS